MHHSIIFDHFIVDRLDESEQGCFGPTGNLVRTGIRAGWTLNKPANRDTSIVTDNAHPKPSYIKMGIKF